MLAEGSSKTYFILMQGLCASIATDNDGLTPQPFLSEVAFTTYLSLFLGQQGRKAYGANCYPETMPHAFMTYGGARSLPLLPHP